MKPKFERFVHNLAMPALKAGAAVMPIRWPKTFEGESGALQLCDYIATKKHNKLLFVTSGTPVRTGLIDPLLERLQQHGIEVVVYSKIKPDPTLEAIEDAVSVLRANDCDAILALGGGSCLDAAKVVGAVAKNDKSILKMTGLFKVHKGMLPLYAVPGTAGTGSEVTIAAVVSDTAAQRKLPIADFRLMPRAVALDGSIMTGLPPHITAATGMDALTHAIEAYISKNAMKRTDELALEAARLINANLETVVANGSDVQARHNMARGSNLAGQAFTQVGVGYVHAIAHNFGALYHTPHGRANAIVMPYVLEYSQPKCADRLADIARACGLGEAGADDDVLATALIARIRALNAKFEIPTQLADLKAGDIGRIASAAREEARFNYAVPRYMDQPTCERIVGKMLVS